MQIHRVKLPRIWTIQIIAVISVATAAAAASTVAALVVKLLSMSVGRREAAPLFPPPDQNSNIYTHCGYTLSEVRDP